MDRLVKFLAESSKEERKEFAERVRIEAIRRLDAGLPLTLGGKPPPGGRKRLVAELAELARKEVKEE